MESLILGFNAGGGAAEVAKAPSSAGSGGAGIWAPSSSTYGRHPLNYNIANMGMVGLRNIFVVVPVDCHRERQLAVGSSATEFEDLPFDISYPSHGSPAPPSEPDAEDAARSPVSNSRQTFHLSSYTIKIVCVSFIIILAINLFIGRRHNELIALCWASQFATKDSIFDKNFNML